MKLVIIGAGSAMFTQGLVADMILSGRAWDLGLVDIDPAALQTAVQLSQRMVELRHADIRIEGSLDRRDLLPGADVVVTTIGVGGRRAWEADVLIPRRYGIFQPVGDTAMPGGVSRAMRMIPAMLDIARDVVRLCPQAHFFNYANPMSAVCWAVRQATGANIVGLCIGVQHVHNDLASFIGAPHNEVTSLAAGVNHFTWVYDLRWRGQDAWPLVRQKLARQRASVEGAGVAAAAQTNVWAARNPFSWSLFATYGAYPAVNDRHVVEFFPERFPSGDYYGKGKLGVDVFSIEDVIARGDKIYAEMQAKALGKAPLDESIFDRTAGEHSQLLDILAAIEGDTRQCFSANLPNGSAIPHLPAGAIIEVTSVATARGLKAIQMPDFPDTLAAPLVRKIAAQQVTVAAALEGSQKLFAEALLMDGSVTDPVTAERMADELLLAHKHYLPQFK